MELMKVCRICLIMDVKLHDLRSYPLECYYESAIGTNPKYATLPPYACYECAALVRKFYFFRQKCLRSQAVLFGTIDDYGKLESSEIRLINRKDLHIISNLNITTLPDLEICQQHKTQTKKRVKHESNKENKYYIGDHNYAALLKDPSLSNNDNELEVVGKEMKSQNKDLQKENADLIEKSVTFAVGTEDLEHAIEGPETIERREKQKTCQLRKRVKHKKQLIHPNLGADGKSDFAQYIDVITLSLEEQKEEIQKRKESSNYLYATYQCNLCYKGFIDNDAWDHHVSKHSVSAGSIECEVCKLRFKTKYVYYKHAANHEKKFACKLCPYVSTSMAQAKHHQGWHKGITYKCKYCDEIFTMWTSYMGHMRIKHPSEFICSYCGYSFISKLGLTMHKTMMHKGIEEKAEHDTEGPYCEKCDVRFISMEAYKRHMVMSVKHTQSTEIKGCRTCGATFENPDEFRQHRKEHARLRPKNYGKKPTTNISSWPAKCEHCPEEFPNALEYWKHFRRAHPDENYPVQRNYMCDICGKSFGANAFLVYHRRTHFEDRPYKCSQCDKAFFNRPNLVLHMKTHSDNRPYPCTVCFKAFKCKGALKRHVQSHTGHRPYECEVCGKTFTQSSSRKLHIRTVHLKQPVLRRNRLERRLKEPLEQFIY